MTSNFSSHYFSFVFLALLFSVQSANAQPDLFGGATGSQIVGNVLDNDGLVQATPRLISQPKFGQIHSSNGADTLGDDGAFIYTPNADFTGLDDFSYEVDINGTTRTFQAMLASGAIQIISANDPSLALFTESLDNRTHLELAERGSGAGTHWEIINSADSYRVKSLLDESANSVIETWQPNSVGEDVTLYQSNSREWQKFTIERSQFGNVSLLSRHTNFTITRIDGELTARLPDGTSKDDWLIAGSDQVAPPSVRDDRFVTLEIDELIQGNVLNNDRSNSADIASFLISGPRHGQFVGLEAEVYGGLAPFGTFNYQPNPGFSGQDSFTYIARGSSKGAPSVLATVNIQVGTQGEPIARNDLFIGAENQNISGRVISNDTAGFASGFASLVSEPRYGTLVGIYQNLYGGLAPFGDFEYQSPEGFNGVDSFAYKMISNNQESKVATVFIVVGDIQIAPLSNWRLNLGATSSNNRTALIVDQADNLVAEAFTPTSTGLTEQYFLGYAGNAVETWSPNASGQIASLYSLNRREWQRFGFRLNENGSYSIQSKYTSRYLNQADSTAGSAVITQALSGSESEQWLIAGPDQSFAPSAKDESYTISVDELLVGNVLANDQANGFDFAAFPVTQPSNGSLVGIEASIYGGVAPWGSFRYQPDSDFVGEDSFVYQVYSSGNGAPSRFATVTITVSE